MSCNQRHFKIEALEQKKIMNKHIKKLHLENEISVYDYVGDSDELYEENNTIFCTAGDNLLNTYYKTIECLNYINKHIEYDYIFRTNTSTFVNIELLYNLIKRIDKDNLSSIVFGTELISVVNTFCPLPNDFYLRGNGLILSKKIINQILEIKYSFMDLDEYPNAGLSFHIYKNTCAAYIDDICLGTALNIINYKDNIWSEIPDKCLKVFKHGWFDCESPWPQYDVNNGCCDWENTCEDYEYLKQFVTIQIKSYKKNNTSYDVRKIKKLSKIFINKHDDEIDKTVDDNLNFTPHCRCFIGAWRKYPYMDLSEVLSFINVHRKYNF